MGITMIFNYSLLAIAFISILMTKKDKPLNSENENELELKENEKVSDDEKEKEN